MDMVFRDDECRIRRDDASANFATIKHIASNLMRRKADQHLMRVKRRLAARADADLAGLISGAGSMRSCDCPGLRPQCDR